DGSWCSPRSSKTWGVSLPERCRLSSRVSPLFVGLTAKIEARRAGDERGLVSSAVFKTVCGALLRRPGWVRFPSIPAKFPRFDSQDDSHSNTRAPVVAEPSRSRRDAAGHVIESRPTGPQSSAPIGRRQLSLPPAVDAHHIASRRRRRQPKRALHGHK